MPNRLGTNPNSRKEMLLCISTLRWEWTDEDDEGLGASSQKTSLLIIVAQILIYPRPSPCLQMWDYLFDPNPADDRDRSQSLSSRCYRVSPSPLDGCHVPVTPLDPSSQHSRLRRFVNNY